MRGRKTHTDGVFRVKDKPALCPACGSGVKYNLEDRIVFECGREYGFMWRDQVWQTGPILYANGDVGKCGTTTNV